jgi:predicted ATP-grasp superfamily ATP-dependent carboligase
VHSKSELDLPLPVDVRSSEPPAVTIGDLTLVRALGLAGIPSVVVTTDPEDITLRSRYVVGRVVVPGFVDRRGETLERLLEAGRHLLVAWGRRAPLFFGTDAQLAFVHDHRDALGEAFAFLLNDDALARSLWDKERFDDIARRAGVPVPLTARGDDHGAIGRLRAPLVVKPRTKVAWRDVQNDLFGGRGKARVFANARELDACPAFRVHARGLLVQEHVPGATRDLASFHGFVDPSSRLLAWFCGRKIRTYPMTAGESSFIELTRDRDVEALGKDVVRRLGLRGVLKIDMIKDPRDGRLFVLEINARYNLWNYLGAAHGVNLPRVAYDLLVRGRAAPPTYYEPRHRWVNFYRDALACREATHEGHLRWLRWAASLAKGSNVYEAFAWTDPRPFAAWLGDQVRRKVA